MTDDVAPLFSHNLDQESYPKLFLKARMDPVPFVKVSKITLFWAGNYSEGLGSMLR